MFIFVLDNLYLETDFFTLRIESLFSIIICSIYILINLVPNEVTRNESILNLAGKTRVTFHARVNISKLKAPIGLTYFIFIDKFNFQHSNLVLNLEFSTLVFSYC